MARVTVEDCLEHENNPFALVVLAAYRARQLMRGAPALVGSKNREAVTALREIADRKVYFRESVQAALTADIEENKRRDRASR
jgi:DNA-directed RNA polymerase subunit omega